MDSGSNVAAESLPSDEELLIAVGAGGLGAFEHLVMRHQVAAWNAAFRFLGDTSEAEDIAQEAFLRVYQASARYVPTARFRTYLYRIVTRLCIDFAEKKRPIYSEQFPDTEDLYSTPIDIATATDRQCEVRRALETLAPKQRMAVVLRYYEGLGYREIAEAMETTIKGVERLLARARGKLQTELTAFFE